MKNNTTTPMTKSSQSNDKAVLKSLSNNQFEDFYLKKDYKAAIEYLLQNKQRMDSGIFHYNLGTVYSKSGDLAAARFHLEKSIKEGYINSSSLNNLAFVKSKLEVDDLSTSQSFPDQVMNSALAIPHTAWISLSLAFLLVSLLLIKTKKIIKKISIVLVFIVSLTPFLFSQYFLEKVNYAIAFKDASLYEGPSKVFSEKGKLKAGSKVILGDFQEGWFYVKFPISSAGWISKDQLGLY